MHVLKIPTKKSVNVHRLIRTACEHIHITSVLNQCITQNDQVKSELIHENNFCSRIDLYKTNRSIRIWDYDFNCFEILGSRWLANWYYTISFSLAAIHTIVPWEGGYFCAVLMCILSHPVVVVSVLFVHSLFILLRYFCIGRP